MDAKPEPVARQPQREQRDQGEQDGGGEKRLPPDPEPKPHQPDRARKAASTIRVRSLLARARSESTTRPLRSISRTQVKKACGRAASTVMLARAGPWAVIRAPVKPASVDVRPMKLSSGSGAVAVRSPRSRRADSARERASESAVTASAWRRCAVRASDGGG